MLLNKKRLFKVIYPEKDNSISESCSDESLLENENYDFAKKERWGKRKRRYFYRDNILQKVKRNFHNIYLINYLNNILKKENSIILFDLFPQAFVNDVSIKDNKNILDMTLKEIFETKDLYKGKKIGKYYYNLNIINNLKNKDTKINYFLENKKYRELYKDYLNSDEYRNKINEIQEQYKEDNKYIITIKNFFSIFLNKSKMSLFGLIMGKNIVY